MSTAPGILGYSAYDQDGAFYIGLNFGQLRKRYSQGPWHAINTGTMSPASAAEPIFTYRIDLPSKAPYSLLSGMRGTPVGKYYLVNAWAAVYRLDLGANSWKK